MSYEVKIKKSALKTLSKMNEPDYSRIKKVIYDLAEEPRPNGCKKLTDKDGYRIRKGNYRIIYTITDKELIVTIIKISHRKEAY